MDQTNLLLLKGRWWKWRVSWSTMETRIQALAMLGCLSPPRGCHLPHQTAWVLRPDNQQEWNIPPAPAPPTHQQRSNLKVLLSIALPIREAQDPPPPTTSPSYQEAYISLLDSLIQHRADGRSKKSYSPAACRTETTITEN